MTKATKAKEKLIQNALALMATEQSDPHIGRFLKDLFFAADPEDLSEYTAGELVEFTKDCWNQFATHKSDTHKIRIFNPKFGKIGKKHKDCTVIEIINDNMPFLVNSVMAALQSFGKETHLVLHPVINLMRSQNATVKTYFGLEFPEGKRGVRHESVIQLHIERIEDKQEVASLKKQLDLVLKDVRFTVRDWPKMRLRLTEAILNFKSNPPSIPRKELEESLEFLDWLGKDNFTFLGMREYKFANDDSTAELVSHPNSSLGILRNPKTQVLRKGSEMVAISPEIREFLLRPEPLIITKANVRSRVHRAVHMDYIGVKQFDKDGILVGELRIVGLFGSSTYTESTKSIPYLRQKVLKVMEKSGFKSSGHSGNALLNVLESYPRDELFQIDIDTLLQFSMTILRLSEIPRVRILPRRDKFNRFVSILVFVPKDRYNSDVRKKIGIYLAKVHEGRVSAWYVTYLEGQLVRVHFVIGHDEGELPDPPISQLEKDATNIVRTWADKLRFALNQSLDSATAHEFIEKYSEAFPASYTEFFDTNSAIEDIKIIDLLDKKHTTEICFYRRVNESGGNISLKVFHSQTPIPLSERVPLLENMGFRVIDERTHKITCGKMRCYLHDMTLKSASGNPVVFDDNDYDRLRELFLSVWQKEAEDDGFNALATLTKLEWRNILVIRAISHYLRQVGILYSKEFMAATLCRHSKIATKLFELFQQRFSNTKSKLVNENSGEQTKTAILAAIEQVESMDDDRVLRRFLNVIESILRTNFFQTDRGGNPKPTVSFKIDSANIIDLPAPKPYREIFVYSPRVEGVHLRFGPVARGGLRWSDRTQDYRTEILGLVKAQQVKNAVIVPVGAKGGFVPKYLSQTASRDEIFNEGKESYKLFVSSLLDITDNIEGKAVIPPKQVVRLDEEDPYLVVAADKGTATFSDTANEISQRHNFWLDDAFASGGSAGYDHKKMGITARGAWEAVKRNFRELNHDIQTKEFTAVGIGDMSGDVFGNGMLLSKMTKLVAAFDHRDIFIDPNPDPKKSWDERKRLFDIGRCSWQDYNKKLLSKGGAVFSRKSKSLKLSPEIQSLLGISTPTATPQEVLRKTLKLSVDMLWMGGIGTYIRSSNENNSDVGDRANDVIRIEAPELRCKVIGEGANLGVTQLARIEFNQLGGRVYSDAVDNSAGVNSSDLEVNIKIALSSAIRDGKLNIKNRNKLLVAMTENVAALVLENNYHQTLAISIDVYRGMEGFSYQERMMHQLESRELLNRAVEFLPSDQKLIEMRAKQQPLTRSEIGVLLSYGKIIFFNDLLATSVPDDPYLEKILFSYFPDKMQSDYQAEIRGHRLRREIITTQLANIMFNRGGPTFLGRVSDQTGASPEDAVRAFVVALEAFGLNTLFDSIDDLDNKILGNTQLDAYLHVQDAIIELTVWFLRNISLARGIKQTVLRFQKAFNEITNFILDISSPTIKKLLFNLTKEYVKVGIPKEVAVKIARIPLMLKIPDAILVSEHTGNPLRKVTDTFFQVAEHFQFGEMDTLARNMSAIDYYENYALDRARAMLAVAHRDITAEALKTSSKKDGFNKWLNMNNIEATRAKEAVFEIIEGGDLTVSKLSVAASILADLTNKKG